MSAEPFDPRSPNAMFATILERLDQQDQASITHRQEIKTTIGSFQRDLRAQDDRVRVLEKSAWKQRGAVGLIAFIIPLAWEWFTSKH